MQEKILLTLVGSIFAIVMFLNIFIHFTAQFMCGEGVEDFLFAGMRFVLTQNPATINTACESVSAIPFNIGIFIGIVSVTMMSIFLGALYRNYKHSPKTFLRNLEQREGFSREKEMKTSVSQKALLKQAPTLRPALKNPQPSDLGIALGESFGTSIWCTCENSICVIGPPRSGKGFRFLIATIIDAPGAVITTSTRPDNLTTTLELRKKHDRPIIIMDLQGVTQLPAGKKWSPISGSENPLVATRRAKDILAGSAASDGSNADWAQTSAIIAASLLHAAAVGKRDLMTLRAWCASPNSASLAVEDLTNAGAAGWGLKLKAVLESDPKLLESSWHSLKMAFDPLFLPEIAKALSPNEDEVFDPEEFLLKKGTLYLISTGAGAANVGGFLSAMMNDVVECARQMAMRSPGGRLDPPLTLVLDEIANLFAWPELPIVLSDGGGQGIATICVFQSLNQARSLWSNEKAGIIWESSNIKIVLGGATDKQDLESLSAMLGTRPHKKTTTQSSFVRDDSYSISTDEKPLMTPAELHRLPDGYAIILYKNLRPMLSFMHGWVERKDAKEIQTSKKNVEATIQANHQAQQVGA